MKKTIAVDFDGVIHAYSKGWHDGTIYDVPIPQAKESIKELSRQFRIVIFTARHHQIKPITKWLMKYDIYFDEVTNVKPPAVAYIDDRGIRFTSWYQALGEIRAWVL